MQRSTSELGFLFLASRGKVLLAVGACPGTLNWWRGSQGGVLEEVEERDMAAALRTELEGKKGQDASVFSEESGAPGSDVGDAGSEGYSADDETRLTMMQKLKERVVDAENHLKGKESSAKEDPHPELAYIPPGDAKEVAAEYLQEGKQHGGVPAEVTRDYSSSEKDERPGGVKTHFSGAGADEPTTMERIKEKLKEAENHMKGKEASEVEDPHPELAYITPMPQEAKPGFFSRMKDNFSGQENEEGETTNAEAAPVEFDKRVQEANKGVGSSEVGTGYEEDSEETINPAAVPSQYDEGVKPSPEMPETGKGIGSSEVGTGYEEGSEGSYGHVPKLSELSIGDSPKVKAQEEEPKIDASNKIHSDAKHPGAVEHVKEDANETKSGDETPKKPGFFSRLVKKVGGK